MELVRRGPSQLTTIILVYLCLLLAVDASWGVGLSVLPGLSFLPSKAWSIALPLSTPLVLGFVWIYYRRKRFPTRAEGDVWNIFVLLYLLYVAAIVIERLIPSPLDTRTVLSTYAYMIAFPAWTMVGYWLGEYPDAARRLAKTLATVTAVVAVLLTTVNYTLGYAGLFGFDWWPVRLTLLFGFCYFLHGVLTLRRSRWAKATLGLACVSSQVLLPLHKPIVWAAACATLAMVILLFMARRVRLRSIVGVAAIVLLTVGVLAAANNASGGRLYRQASAAVYESWFHAGSSGNIAPDWATAIRQASGGRDVIVADVWPRFYESPLVGSGFGQRFSGLGMDVQIHNFFLDVLLGIGVLGAIPLFGGLLFWLASISRAMIRARGPDLAIPVACYAIGIGGYGIVAGNFTLFYVPGILAALCIGITLRMAFRGNDPSSRARIAQRGPNSEG